MVQHVHTMLVEDVARAKQSYHVEKCELLLVKHGWRWEGAREQVHSWGWGTGMEALKLLEGGTTVEGENIKFTGCQAEGGQTTEQLGSGIGGLNPQTGSRITPVVSGHPTGDDTVE